MPVSKIPSAGIDAGGVAPSNLSTGAPAWDSSGNLSFNSGFGSNATAYGCRAWVNFNGTGTVAIRASGNVSSITDGGTGIYTINFTTAMPDTDYAVLGTCERDGGNSDNTILSHRTRATGSVVINTARANVDLTDMIAATVAIIR